MLRTYMVPRAGIATTTRAGGGAATPWPGGWAPRVRVVERREERRFGGLDVS